MLLGVHSVPQEKKSCLKFGYCFSDCTTFVHLDENPYVPSTFEAWCLIQGQITRDEVSSRRGLLPALSATVSHDKRGRVGSQT